MEQSVKNILSTIDDAIAKFQESIPGIQKLVYDELQPVLKELQIRNGKLLSNIDNLKLLGTLKTKLEKVIINAEYKKSVDTFIDAFTKVSNVQNEYFSQFNKEYKPKNTLPIIKQLAIEDTINGLMGQGMSSNIIEPIRKVLNQNITTGGSYADMQDQLRKQIIQSDGTEGSLEKYTKQITTDALHQYNAQYHETIAQDLQFNWGQYVGSNIVTSRELCILLAKKRWIHKTELPGIIKGEIDGKQCKLSPTTGLPYGLIPGTNPENFKIRRGGYNCGHQFFWVPDSSVPADLLGKFKDKPVIKPIEKPEENPAPLTKVDAIKKENAEALADIEKKGIPFYDDLAKYWDPEIQFQSSTKEGAYYMPGKKILHIGGGDRLKTDYYRNMIMAHEGAHAMHIHEKIITFDFVREDFKKFHTGLKKIVKGKEADLFKELQGVIVKNYGDKSVSEQVMVYMDTLGALTGGKYGYGHSARYYKTSNGGQMEIFAHAVTLYKISNEFSELNETIAEMTKAMKEYASNLFEGI